MKGEPVGVGTLWCWSCSFVWGLCRRRAAKAAFSKVLAPVRLIWSNAATIWLYGRINWYLSALSVGGNCPFLVCTGALACTDWMLLKSLYDWIKGNNLSPNQILPLKHWKFNIRSISFDLRRLKTFVLTMPRSQAHNPLLIPALFVLKFTYLPDFSL